LACFAGAAASPHQRRSSRLPSRQKRYDAAEHREAKAHTTLGTTRVARQSALTGTASTKSEASIVALQASGTFEVKLAPQPLADSAADGSLGRMTIDKTFSGDLQGTSKGEMLTAGRPDKGSAGYVAVECFRGVLHGHSGTFALQHSGTMHRGAFSLTVAVVPDSGTESLTGISGAMDIKIVDGKHFYTFDYLLPAGQ
jgi:hypothetical protein